MANPLVSQLKVDNVTYDIKDSYLRDLLLTDVVDEKSTYIFRKTGGDKNSEIGDRNKEFINEIIGGSLVVNQLLKNGDFEDSSAWYSITGPTYAGLSIADNIATLTITTKNSSNGIAQQSDIPLLAGHKILIQTAVKPSTDCYVRFGTGSSLVNFNLNPIKLTANQWNNISVIGNVASGNTLTAFLYYIDAGGVLEAGETVQFRYAEVVDITQFFGSSTIADYVYNLEQATAKAGISWLYEYFPILNGGYIPYNTGKIESICISKHIMTRFNHYKGNAEYGNISMDGPEGSSTLYIRTDAFTRVLPNTDYYIYAKTNSTTTNGQLYVLAYDINKQTIERRQLKSSGTLNPAAEKYTTPSNCVYIKSFIYSGTALTLEGTVFCISFDSDRNGEYEPFQGSIYPLDSSKELRGVPKIDSNGKLYFYGDRYKDGVTRRFGILDLGTPNWITQGDGQFYYEDANFDGASDAYGENLICPSYLGGDAYGGGVNKTISIRIGTYRRIWIKDTSYTTSADLKASLAGKMLVYLLATSTTESATAIPNPQSCDVYGTEEFVDAKVESGERALSIPVCCTTTYLAGINSDTSTLHVVDEDTETLYVFD